MTHHPTKMSLTWWSNRSLCILFTTISGFWMLSAHNNTKSTIYQRYNTYNNNNNNNRISIAPYGRNFRR